MGSAFLAKPQLDADNRLIGIAYPGTPGKAPSFAYDGLGRRTTISHTPAGGGAAVATTYVWCGNKPCQARNASNQPQRAYYTEGEQLLGSSSSSLFYGVDQLGSVRRVFASPTSAPAYSYDPYGVPPQTTAPLTDFGYAGLLNEPDSGLGLATYRAYDPSVGRWISRDPIGERENQAGNLYSYVDWDPINWIDSDGTVKKKSPTFICVACEAPHGGAFGPYCPDCYKKSLQPGSCIPPLVFTPPALED